MRKITSIIITINLGGYMEEIVGVYSDSSKEIDYKTILGYYKVDKLNNLENVKNCILVIIELKEIYKAIETANKIRELNKSIPLLVIVDYPYSGNKSILKGINGTGATRILEYRDRYKSNILLYSQNLIHPEYPGKKHDIAIIVPIFDEAERFQNIINQTQKLKGLVESSFLNTSVYFINDGSKDDTLKLINKLIAATEDEVNFIERSPILSAHNLIANTRKAGTYIEGIKNVDAEYIFFLDGDDSFTMEDLSKMINILMDGYYDFVVATKDKTAENRPLIRRLLSFSKRLLTKRLLPAGVNDSQTGLKGMRNIVAKTLLSNMHIQNGLAADLEMLYLAKQFKFRVLELPVTCYDREGSHVNIIKDSLMFIKAIINIPRQNKGIKYE